jgi:hypothetical protein
MSADELFTPRHEESATHLAGLLDVKGPGTELESAHVRM